MATIVIVTVLLFGLLWVGYLYVAQDSLIYYPRGYSGEEIAVSRKRCQQLTFETSAGKQAAFYASPRGGPDRGMPKRVWVLFGGNGARALDWVDLLDAFDSPGAGFLLVDYPGYGICEGKPSPESIEESITGAVAAVAVHLGVKEEEFAARMAVMGHSLGAAAALCAAENYGAKKIVLISPFTTMKEMAAQVVGGPLSNMLHHQYDNRARVRALLERQAVEMTIIHGADDSSIPERMGRELSEIDPERIPYHAVPGAGHNDIFGPALPLIREAMR